MEFKWTSGALKDSELVRSSLILFVFVRVDMSTRFWTFLMVIKRSNVSRRAVQWENRYILSLK